MDHFSCYESSMKYYPWETSSNKSEKLKKQTKKQNKTKNPTKLIAKLCIKVTFGNLKPAMEENYQH